MTGKEKRTVDFRPWQLTFLKRILKQFPTSKCWQTKLLMSFKKQFPDADGLQDPLLGQLLCYQIYWNTPFVQVIHNRCYHWLALSTYRFKQGEIFVLDTKFYYSLSIQTKKNLCLVTLSTRDHLGYYCTSPTADMGSWLLYFCNSLFTFSLIMQTNSSGSILCAIKYDKSYPEMSQK